MSAVAARTWSSSRATTPAPPSTPRSGRRAPPGRRCGWWSTAAPTARPRACAPSPPPTPGCGSMVLPRNVGKGAAVLHALRGGAGGRLQPCADDGLGRPASGRPDPGVHAGVARARPTRWCSAGRCSTPRRRCCGCAAVGSRTGGPTSRRSAPASTIRCTAFASTRSAPLVEVMRGQRWMRRFDFDTEAVVRLAWRGVRPINLAAPVKYLRAGRRRRLALPLRPRQRAADLDAPAADGRVLPAPAVAARPQAGRPAAVPPSRRLAPRAASRQPASFVAVVARSNAEETRGAKAIAASRLRPGVKMSSKSILVAALTVVAGTLAWQSVSAQTAASGPLTREQRKAETAAAEQVRPAHASRAGRRTAGEVDRRGDDPDARRAQGRDRHGEQGRRADAGGSRRRAAGQVDRDRLDHLARAAQGRHRGREQGRGADAGRRRRRTEEVGPGSAPGFGPVAGPSVGPRSSRR